MKLAVPEKGDDRMRSFVYVITDRAGIHARPAGIVVKEAKKYDSEIKVSLGGKECGREEADRAYVHGYQVWR